jgi:hypothetical protein
MGQMLPEHSPHGQCELAAAFGGELELTPQRV